MTGLRIAEGALGRRRRLSARAPRRRRRPRPRRPPRRSSNMHSCAAKQALLRSERGTPAAGPV